MSKTTDKGLKRAEKASV